MATIGMLLRRSLVLMLLSVTLGALTACSLVTVGRNNDGSKPPSSAYVQEVEYDSMLTVVAKSQLPIFIEEYDPKHCDAACARQHEVVNTLAEAYKDKVRFYRVTTNEEEFDSGVAQPVYYMAKPPLQVYDTESGAKSEAELRKFIDEAYAAMQPPKSDPSKAPARTSGRTPSQTSGRTPNN